MKTRRLLNPKLSGFAELGVNCSWLFPRWKGHLEPQNRQIITEEFFHYFCIFSLFSTSIMYLLPFAQYTQLRELRTSQQTFAHCWQNKSFFGLGSQAFFSISRHCKFLGIQNSCCWIFGIFYIFCLECG